MIRNNGIIKELFADKKTVTQKIEALAKRLNVSVDTLVYREDDYIEFNDEHYDNYAFINRRLFDISNAPDERESDGESYKVTKVAEGEYLLDLYYYNGGTCMEEIVAEKLDEIDKEPVGQNYYAVRLANGRYVTRANSEAPALYSTPARAEATAKKHFFGLLDDGYEVVRFIEAN